MLLLGMNYYLFKKIINEINTWLGEEIIKSLKI